MLTMFMLMRMEENLGPRLTTIRFSSLDGLRGAAALTVVFFHASFSLKIFGAQAYTGAIWDLMDFTPIHVLVQGREAVHLFFVLSGLTLPLLLNRLKPLGRPYLFSRLVRLYAPAWIALTLYLLALVSIGTAIDPGAGGNITLKLVRDYLMVFGPQPGSEVTLGVLWSLAFEIIFSVTIFLWRPLVKSCAFVPMLLASIFLMTVGDLLHVGILQYMPMFLIGMVTLANLEKLKGYIQNFSAKLSQSWLLAISLSLISLEYIVKPWIPISSGSTASSDDFLRPFFYMPEFLGILLLIGLALVESKLRTFLTTKVVLWFGKISFSLYLTHQLAILLWSKVDVPEWPRFALVIVTSLILGSVFYLVFERYIHAFARKIARSA